MKKQFGNHITVNPSEFVGQTAVDWTKMIMIALNDVYAKQTGQAVLAQLRRTKKHVVIVPFNHVEFGGNEEPSNLSNGYYQFRPVRNGDGSYHGGIGTGKGSDATIRLKLSQFEPWMRPVAMIHEMVHAAEDMAGVMYSNPIGWDMLTTTEFDAIVVQNIFSSECGEVQIRNHKNWDPWYPVMGKMVPQDDAYKRLLRSFKARMPAMVDQLSRVKTSFNPYYKGAQGYIPL